MKERVYVIDEYEYDIENKRSESDKSPTLVPNAFFSYRQQEL